MSKDNKRFIKQVIPLKVWRKLGSSLREAWNFIWMNCDEAGVYVIDEDLYEFNNQCEFPLNKLKEKLNEWLLFHEDKILIKAFIETNYGNNLKPDYNPHKPLFRAIKNNNLKLEPSLNQAYFKLVDEDEDEEEDEEVKEDEDKTFEKSEKLLNIEVKDEIIVKPKKTKPKEIEIIFPFHSEKFKVQWQLWKQFKKKEFRFNYKSSISEQAALKKLSELSEGNENTAILIIHQSISEGWKGLFELKNNGTQKSNDIIKNQGASDDFRAKTAQRLGLVQS